MFSVRTPILALFTTTLLHRTIVVLEEMPGLRLQRGTLQSLHLTSAYRRLPWRDAGLPRGQIVTGRRRGKWW